MLNLAEIKPQTHSHEVTKPGSAEPIGLRLELVSMNDERTKAARRSLENKHLHRRQRNKSLTADELHKDRVETVVGAVVGWTWHSGLSWNDEELEFTKPNLRTVLEALPWLVDQLDEAIGDEANFFR